MPPPLPLQPYDGKGCGRALSQAARAMAQVGDKFYHADHFCCKDCGTSLAGGGYFEEGGDVVCKADYQKRTGR